ncbi:uncharacterized protein LOC113375678 [Ctenocephalides felis]|uniref:uncharacterized protein LOC113375678 n=1 Tax=Ctenocephalides felis TaxID=7515 RepID=UPI000E6E2235|nr:uncharacterized protein LOC113375678 [Ctenocephalides felis]
MEDNPGCSSTGKSKSWIEMMDEESNMTNEDNTRNNKINEEINYYEPYDEGSYTVFAESTNESIGRFHNLALGRLIFKQSLNIRKNIIDISKIGRNKIKLVFKDYFYANKLIKEKILEKFNIRTYIPRHKLYKTGIIFNVEPDMNEQEIMDVIRSVIKILDVKCIKRRNLEKINMKSQMVKIVFRGNYLPEYVSMYSVRCAVSPYIQSVMQCHKCWRYGHIKNQCKSKIRCRYCSEEHSHENCHIVSDFICAVCHGNHQANDKECKFFKVNKEIKEMMALHNISYLEAKNRMWKKGYAEAAKINPYNPGFNSSFPRLNGNTEMDSHRHKNKYELLNSFDEQEINIVKDRLMLMNKPRNIMYKRRTEYLRPINRFNRDQITEKPEKKNQEEPSLNSNKTNKKEENKRQLNHFIELALKLREKIECERNKECKEIDEIIYKLKWDTHTIMNYLNQNNKTGIDNRNKDEIHNKISVVNSNES